MIMTLSIRIDFSINTCGNLHAYNIGGEIFNGFETDAEKKQR